jgi:hypothetical protein
VGPTTLFGGGGSLAAGVRRRGFAGGWGSAAGVRWRLGFGGGGSLAARVRRLGFGGGGGYASAVIEMMRFRLQAGTDEAAFLAADRRVQREFADQQPGLVSRTTARGADGGWIVIDLWRSAADADACDIRWGHNEATRAFMDLLDRSSVAVERYQELD